MIRILSLVLCLALPLHAETLRGRVVAVSDGDTLTVLDADQQSHKIRLGGIDAPEKKQAFGQRAKQHLSTLVFQRQVTVEWHKHDRYQRIIGKVLLDGEDINIQQIQAGLAWWYEAYRREQTPQDQEAYRRAEIGAQVHRMGLWSESNPIPPWQWRKSKR